MKKNGILLLMLMVSFTAFSQTFNGDVILTTQSEVDTFGANHYTSILGKLTIESSNTDAISSLASLNTLESIGTASRSETGLTIVGNHTLSSLSGLENVKSVFGDLIIENNNQLTNLQGLSSLTHIHYDTGVFGGNFIVRENAHLETLEELSSLESIALNTEIIGNASLASISVLQDVAYSNVVRIESNASLLSLEGLKINNLSQLWIVNNDGIASFEGLGLQGVVQRALVISDNEGIVNLLGFENISFGVFFSMLELTISGNSQLTTLQGLPNLTGIVSVSIDNNPLLSDISLLSTFTAGGIHIGNSPSISSLLPLSNYTGSKVKIEGNNGFTNLSGLENITNLTSLELSHTNLSDVSQIGIGSQLCELILEGNHSLSDVSSFEELTSIGGACGGGEKWYLIDSNLSSLDAFRNLTQIDVVQLRIWDNTNLEDYCGLFNVFSADSFSGLYWVENNLYNPTETQIANGQTCGALSISKYDKLEVSIYPNPAFDYLTINTKNQVSEIDIYTLTGKKIASYTHINRIAIEHLASGIYLLQIKDTNHNIQRIKFIKY